MFARPVVINVIIQRAVWSPVPPPSPTSPLHRQQHHRTTSGLHHFIVEMAATNWTFFLNLHRSGQRLWPTASSEQQRGIQLHSLSVLCRHQQQAAAALAVTMLSAIVVASTAHYRNNDSASSSNQQHIGTVGNMLVQLSCV